MSEGVLQDREIDELIKVLKGGVKERKRGPLTLWLFPYDRAYTLDEQAKAIERLGRSRSKRALDFLLEIDELGEQTETSIERNVWSYDKEQYYDREYTCTYHDFPNASEPLRTRLIIEQAYGEYYYLLMGAIMSLRENQNS